MKIYFLSFFLLFMSLKVFSQEGDQPVLRDTLKVTGLNKERSPINDKETTAIDTFQVEVTSLSSIDSVGSNANTTVVKGSRSELSLTISIKDYSGLDSVFIKYGTSPGLGDVMNLKLKCAKINGIDYLVMNDKTYQVTGKEAVLHFSVPSIFLKDKNYIWVKGKRKDGTYTSDYIR